MEIEYSNINSEYLALPLNSDGKSGNYMFTFLRFERNFGPE